MPYITGPFYDSAGVLGEGSATVEQTANFEASDGGVVVAVVHRFHLKQGALYEDAQFQRPAFIPLPPLDFPVRLTLKIGAESSDPIAKRFPPGTTDESSVAWAAMIAVEDPADPIGWVIPANLQRIYGSLDEAVSAAVAAAGSASAAAEFNNLARDWATIAETSAAQAGQSKLDAARSAASTRGRIVLLQPDPFTVDDIPVSQGGVPILAGGRPVFLDPGDSDTPPGDGGVVTWGSILNIPDILARIGAGEIDVILDDDPRLTDARAPLAHTHAIAAVSGLSDALAAKASLEALTPIVDALDDKAPYNSPAFTGTPTAPDPDPTDLDAIATVGYVQSATGTAPGGVPDATATLAGKVRLPGDGPGVLGGDASRPTVIGFDDKADRTELAGFARTTDLGELASIVGSKADSSQVTTALSGKADKSALDGKQDLVVLSTSDRYFQGDGVWALKSELPLTPTAVAEIAKTRGGGGPASIVTWTGAVTIPAATARGRMYVATLTGNVTLTVEAGPAVVSNAFDTTTITLVLRQGTTGSRLITWPSNVKWPGVGAKPTLTTTPAGIDYITLVWDGIEWLGFLGGATFA